jgi:hypothetical protein
MLNGEGCLVRPSWPLQRLIIINSYRCVRNLLTYDNFGWCSTKKILSAANPLHQLPTMTDLGFCPFKHICAIEKGQNTQERKYSTRAC